MTPTILCEDCFERGKDVPFTVNRDGKALCDSCDDRRNEEAHEAFVSAFFGSDEPVTDREHEDAQRAGHGR